MGILQVCEYRGVGWHLLRHLAVGVLLIASACVAARGVHAQEARTITFEEAVHIVMQQNTDLKRAQNAVHFQGVVTTRERMDFFPDLQLSSGGSRSFGRGFSQEEGEIINETSNFFNLDASASVNLFNGFENIASLRRAGLVERASAHRLERTRQDVVFQVIDGFIILLQNRQLAQVRAQELETQRDLLRQVEALVEVGRRPKSDLYQQQAARAETRAALAEARLQVEVSKTQLIQALELDPLGTYTFEAPALADSSTAPVPATYDLDRLLETAFARRADLDALEANVAASRQGVHVAQSGYWPSLSLSAGYGSGWASSALLPIPGTGTDPRMITVMPTNGGPPATFEVPGTGSDPSFQRPSFLDQLDNRRGGSITLSLSFPLFDRLETRTNVEEAQVQLQNTRYDLQDQRQLVALQVRQALLEYRSTQTQLSATEERLQAAQLAHQAARRRYELGAATFVELAQATSEYIGARSARVRARYRVLLAQKLIRYYTGTLDTQAPLFPTDR